MAKQAYVRLQSGLVIETDRPDLWKEGTRNGEPDTAGGYALKQEAL